MAAWFCSNGAKAKLLQIVHPSGHVELHDDPVQAAEILLRNPKFCLTHSQSQAASRQPWAIVSPDTTLMLGRKYYLFPESSVGKVQKRPAIASRSAKENNGDSDSVCFSGGNCMMCLADGIKSRKENERIIGCEEELEGKMVKKRGVFSENGKKNKQFQSRSSDNWEPSLNSITEEY